VPENKGLGEISRDYQSAYGYQLTEIADADAWTAYRERMMEASRRLLGEAAVLPRRGEGVSGEPLTVNGIQIQRVAWPSEDRLVVPSVVLCPAERTGKLPVTILLDAAGKESLLAETGDQSPRRLAAQGNLVVLPDVRTYGEMFATGEVDANRQREAWERNGIVWGRPVPGTAATDLRAVLDGIAAREDADPNRVTVVVRNSGDLSIAALFAVILDSRIHAADLDFAGSCFANRRLPLVANVLRHGDVLAWAATVADRHLVLHHLSAEAGDVAWLKQAFAAAGNPDGLTIR